MGGELDPPLQPRDVERKEPSILDDLASDRIGVLGELGQGNLLAASNPVDEPEIEPARARNTAAAAASDFITPGSISQKAIDAYVAQSLEADPIKADLLHLDHYNALDGEMIHVPTLVIAGEYDPLAPAEFQARLYMRLATGHKQWVTVPGGDHAAFLEAPRAYFIHELVAFLQGVSL